MTLETGAVVASAGLSLTVLGLVVKVAHRQGGIEEMVRSMHEQFRSDGGNGFVRRREIDLLKEQADHEHEIMNNRIRTIGERTHRNTEDLARVRAEVDALKEA